jgi:hypothetical protein
MANGAALVAAWNVVRGRAIDRWEPSRGPVQSTAVPDDPAGSPPIGLDQMEAGLRRLRGDARVDPTASVVVPVNAQGDLENVLALLSDLVRYDGPHTLEVVLVVNNFAEGEPPAETERLEGIGTVVLAVPSVRQTGYAIPLMARLHGIRIARSDRVLLFDADCRIPDSRALVDWYVNELTTAPVAYTHVDFYELSSHPSVRIRRHIHHTARWIKRVVFHLPTVRGSNYAVRREAFLDEFERGTIADDMNVGPTFRDAGARVAYSGARQLVVLTSGRMYIPGWRRLGKFASYRLRYNLRVLPVSTDAVRRTHKEHDRPRRYVDNRPVS